ncbi:MAG TPA: hypothetical protein VNT03_03605 [Baekduia sp.]|nr:hypothetical protein [Baekduia sp.]
MSVGPIVGVLRHPVKSIAAERLGAAGGDCPPADRRWWVGPRS